MISIRIKNPRELAASESGSAAFFFARMLDDLSIIDLNARVDKEVGEQIKQALHAEGFRVKITREEPSSKDPAGTIGIVIENLEEAIGSKIMQGLKDAGVVCDVWTKDGPVPEAVSVEATTEQEPATAPEVMNETAEEG